jgi:precorrin isomerase
MFLTVSARPNIRTYRVRQFSHSIIAAGRRQLKAETARWTDMTAVVAGILNEKVEEI